MLVLAFFEVAISLGRALRCAIDGQDLQSKVKLDSRYVCFGHFSGK